MSKILIRYQQGMKKIQIDITARDRKKAEEKFGYTKGTISLYINCDPTARNADIYYDLLGFFRECIDERLSLLNTVTA
jgi:hypothetical protein